MNSLNPYLDKAQNSKNPWALWQLNLILWKLVPFNLPHQIKVTEVGQESLTMNLPFIRKNMNHIRGIHACALATLCEYVCGLHLLRLLGTDQYRIILKSLKMDYYLQGKTKVHARFELGKEFLKAQLDISLKSEESLIQVFKIDVFDEENRLICTGIPEWQIKSWSKVKTKL